MSQGAYEKQADLTSSVHLTHEINSWEAEKITAKLNSIKAILLEWKDLSNTKPYEKNAQIFLLMNDVLI